MDLKWVLTHLKHLFFCDLCAKDFRVSPSVSPYNPSFRAGSVSCCGGRRIPLQRTGRSGKTSPWSAASWASPRPSATPSTSRRAAPGSSTTTSGRLTWCTSPLSSYRWAWLHVSWLCRWARHWATHSLHMSRFAASFVLCDSKLGIFVLWAVGQ